MRDVLRVLSGLGRRARLLIFLFIVLFTLVFRIPIVAEHPCLTRLTKRDNDIEPARVEPAIHGDKEPSRQASP